jgi:hypothetical protein
MRTRKLQWLATASAVFALSSSAGAVEIFTSALQIRPGEVVTCSAANSANSAQEIFVELLDGGASLLGPQDCVAVKPRGVCRQVASFQPSDDHFVSCRITASSRAAVRGLIENDTRGNSSPAR